MPEFSLARTFRNRGLLLQTGSQFSNSAASKEMLFPNNFSTLQKVVFQENKTELLKKYLKNDWYNKDCGCYEAHKSRQNIYYGYWSFEAGAVAKILQLDDKDLRNVPYYPYDMVHYKD